MLFGRKTHPLNFAYGERITVDANAACIEGRAIDLRVTCDDIADYCLRLRFDNAHVTDKRQHSDGIADFHRTGRAVSPEDGDESVHFAARAAGVELSASALRLRFASGVELANVTIGVNGESFLLNFDVSHATGFYGFGERTKRLNKQGDSMDFWNVDVVSVFRQTCARDDYDPAYVAIPLAILRLDGLYCGVYFDNPGRAVIDAGSTWPGQMLYQVLAGNTDVYFLAGPGLRDVVRQFADLTGRAAVPPLWSLGYHQCRWSYLSADEFRALKDQFAQHEIPVSALWYDIDYMDEYRLFTWNQAQFPDPAGLNEELRAAGIRNVAIIDPGVKLEPGYWLYDSGHEQNFFCKTHSGREYVGKVWPGDTVFPDFSQGPVRDWWRERLAQFVKNSGFDGVWLDMNDPSTGYSAVEDMLFEQGNTSHDRYHNQYAHFMAKASRQACEQIDPDGRPFLLTRSAYTGTQRYSAVWTGDNASNWRHLRMSIPCTLNLGLSGVAFNGPDVGGFMGDTTPELLIRWHQAGMLFPFFRNHSARDSVRQEPWRFGEPGLSYIRAAIQTRYRLLPYLYQCFFQHYLSGDPVLRPLLYEYNSAQYENLDDQFLLGDSLLAAPIVTGQEETGQVSELEAIYQQRAIYLPPGWWFDLNRGQWTQGDSMLNYTAGLGEIPLFMRDGAIIPYYNGPLRNSVMPPEEIELHIFSREKPASARYFIDDQSTRAYQHEQYNTAYISMTMDEATMRIDITEKGRYPAGAVHFTPVLYGVEGERQAVITHNSRPVDKALQAATRQWVGKAIDVLG